MGILQGTTWILVLQHNLGGEIRTGVLQAQYGTYQMGV